MTSLWAQRNVTSGLRMDRKLALSDKLPLSRCRPGNGRAETARTIDIEKFVPRDKIEWIDFDTHYFPKADEKIGNEAFAVIREATKAQDVVSVSQVVLGRRERAVILEPRGAASLSGRCASVTKSGRK